MSTWYVALGVALLLAVRRRSWRVPVLFLAVLQYALHLVNHLVDVGKADPGRVGPADVVSLLLTGGAVRLGAGRRGSRTPDRASMTGPSASR